MTSLRWYTAGESHGPALTVVVDGFPAGLRLSAEDIRRDLVRRQRGYGRGGRMKIERDAAVIEAGVRGGETLGSPIALRIENLDFVHWLGTMGAAAFDTPPVPVVTPRPGHADLAGGIKYNRHDLRDVLERASARETAARVAVGAIARRLLAEADITLASRVVAIATVTDESHPTPMEVTAAAVRLDASDLRVMDTSAEALMKTTILAASHAGDTVGGVVEAVAVGVVPGLGSYASWDRRLDGRIARAVMSVPSVKAVEIGDGWASAALRGSWVHDPIGYDPAAERYTRASNHAGGIEGGVTNGEPVVVRAAVKPISTLRRPLESVDVRTHRASPATGERSDVCAVPAAGVVVEAMLALVLAESLLEKFGGDTVGDLSAALDAYRARVRTY